MRSLGTALVAVVALGVSGIAHAQKPEEKPAPPGQAKKEGGPPGLAKKEGAPPGLAKKGGLPPGLAKKFGPDVPEEAWIAFHPTRDDGAWFLIDYEWTLVTGFSPSLRAEVKEARKRPAKVPPIPPPNVGVELHVVLFE
jgi:hypothetical protein